MSSKNLKIKKTKFGNTERYKFGKIEEVMDILDAEGVGVVMDAQHLCMQMRGVEKQNSVMTTSSMLGSFRRELATRNEFTRLIR